MWHHTSVLEIKIGAFIQLSELEQHYLSEIQNTPIRIKRGMDIVHEGEPGQVAYIIHSGWACSFKLLPNGGRQIIAFPVPGDCVGFRSMLLRTSDHSFSALTDLVVTRIAAPRIKEIFTGYPYIGSAILWATSRDEAMIVEHLVSIGRRNAIERTAHFFLELYDRLKMVGLTTGHEFACPLNQNVLADALGLSTIHVNRVLRALRDRKLMTFQNHRVILHDEDELKVLAGYERPEDSPMIVRDETLLRQAQ